MSRYEYSNAPEWEGNPKRKKTGWGQRSPGSSRTPLTSGGWRYSYWPGRVQSINSQYWNNSHNRKKVQLHKALMNSHGPCWSAWRRRSKQRTRMVWRLGNCSHQAGANFIYPQTKLSRRLCFFKHPTSCMTKNRIRMSTSRMFGDWSVISKKSNFWCHGQDIRPRKKRHGDFAN